MMDPHTDIPQSEARTGEDRQPVAPIESRFMFVDVAALRAKQLRRGALVRVTTSHEAPHKLERLAMEEVRRGLVEYTVPDKRAVMEAATSA
jgi:DNA-directed RNA polymerase omega subunit